MAPRKASAESAAKKAAEAEAKKAPETEAPVAEAKKPAAKKPAAKKPAAKKPAAKKAVEVIVQSPLGGEISFAEILAKVGEADKVYVRVDQNKAYWVRGEETGDVDLW
jgi:biotin carboxyl carrier protein